MRKNSLRVIGFIFYLFFGVTCNAINVHSAVFSQLTVSAVDINTGMNQLIINGYNFNTDAWGAPEVKLNDTILNISSFNTEEIIAVFPVGLDPEGSYLLTVQTGDDKQNYDTYSLVLGGDDPVTPLNQLLIDFAYVTYDENIGSSYLLISGVNFDNGQWPPVVQVGDTEFIVNEDKSDSFQIFAEAPILSADTLEDILPVTVQVGNNLQNYDIWISPTTTDLPVGYGFEENWKECPDGWKENIGRRGEEAPYPLCFQLKTNLEYDLGLPYIPWSPLTINLPCPPDPRFAFIGPMYCFGAKQDIIFNWITNNMAPIGTKIDLDTESEKKFFVLEPSGILKIKKGFRWDGPTPPGKMSKPVGYKQALLEASLVHDALYDLMRMEKLERDTKLITSGGDGFQNQRVADNMFHVICEHENSHDLNTYWKCTGWWYGIRLGGAYSAHKNVAIWKSHALANAGEDLSFTCTPPEGKKLVLNGSGSIWAETWDWSWGNGHATGEITEPKLFTPGIHAVTLKVDCEGDCHKYYMDTDETTISVTPDITPPLLTVPKDIAIECDESREPSNTGTASAYDTCDTSPTVSFTDVILPGECSEESTIKRTWTVTDFYGNTQSSDPDQIITIKDTISPVISCNTPISITPPDAPISFIATATDNCSSKTLVEITGYDCYKYTKKGKRIDKTESCMVELVGDTITILESGGVGTYIDWKVVSSDACGNVAEETCETLVVSPSRKNKSRKESKKDKK